MKRFKKTLVATDTRFDDHPVLSTATGVAIHIKNALTEKNCSAILGS